MKLIMTQSGGEEGAMNLLSRPHLSLLTLALSSLTKEKNTKTHVSLTFLEANPETLFWKVLTKW